jgi:hypothetical protein
MMDNITKNVQDPGSGILDPEKESFQISRGKKHFVPHGSGSRKNIQKISKQIF